MVNELSINDYKILLDKIVRPTFSWTVQHELFSCCPTWILFLGNCNQHPLIMDVPALITPPIGFLASKHPCKGTQVPQIVFNTKKQS